MLLSWKALATVIAILVLGILWEKSENGRWAMHPIQAEVLLDTRTGRVYVAKGSSAGLYFDPSTVSPSE